MSFHIPISDALKGMGRLYFDKNFHASKRNSIILLIRANNGARLENIFQKFQYQASTQPTEKPQQIM